VIDLIGVDQAAVPKDYPHLRLQHGQLEKARNTFIGIPPELTYGASCQQLALHQCGLEDRSE
jgi:hypothetical protein